MPTTHAQPTVLPVDGPVRLRVEAGAGDVHVEAREGATTVTVELTHRPGDADLAARTQVRHDGDVVEVLVPRGAVGGLAGLGELLGRGGSVGVRAVVPAGSDAELSTRSGDITTTGTLGRLDCQSGSGEVTAGDVTDDATVATGSGDIQLASCGDARLRAGSGDIRVGEVRGRLEVGTGSGDVQTGDVGGRVTVRTGSGEVRLGRTSADVSISAASGDVVVRGAVTGEVEVKTASGDITVGVPHGTAAFLDCSSVSGRLTSDLAATGAPDPEAHRLVLRLRSVSGDVHVRRP